MTIDSYNISIAVLLMRFYMVEGQTVAGLVHCRSPYEIHTNRAEIFEEVSNHCRSPYEILIFELNSEPGVSGLPFSL